MQAQASEHAQIQASNRVQAQTYSMCIPHTHPHRHPHTHTHTHTHKLMFRNLDWCGVWRSPDGVCVKQCSLQRSALTNMHTLRHTVNKHYHISLFSWLQISSSRTSFRCFAKWYFSTHLTRPCNILLLASTHCNYRKSLKSNENLQIC